MWPSTMRMEIESKEERKKDQRCKKGEGKRKCKRYLHLYINVLDKKDSHQSQKMCLKKCFKKCFNERPQRSLERVSPQQQRPLLTDVPSWQLYRRRLRRVGTRRQYSKPPPLTCQLNSPSPLGPIFFLSLLLLLGQKILTAGNQTFTFTLVCPASSLDPN